MTRTRELLKATDHTALAIYDATGVSPDWQARFTAGRINDPGVNRVEALYTFLTGKSLGL